MSRLRRTLEPCLYEDQYGPFVKVQVMLRRDRLEREVRFPPGTPLATLRKCVKALRHKLWAELDDRQAKAPPPANGTLAEALTRAVAELPGDMPTETKANRVRDLEAWREPFGTRDPQSLTRDDIKRQMEAWLYQGLAGSTINKRRQALMHLLDRFGGANPARAKGLRLDEADSSTLETDDRGQPLALLALIFAEIRDTMPAPKGTIPAPNLTKIRLLVMLSTGLPPAQIMKLGPGSFDRTARTLHVSRRRKGKGAEARTLPLNDVAVEALSRLYALKAFGTYDRRAARRMFARAVTRAKATYEKAHGADSWPAPADLRPYDLRHSYLTELLKHTGDLSIVAHHGLHADLKMAMRYTRSIVNERAIIGRDAVNPSFVAAFLPAPATPTLAFRRKRKA